MAASGEVATAIDRLEASSGALALLRLQHLVLAGHVGLDETQRAEVERLWGSGSNAARLGLELDAPASAVREAALAGVERWRAIGGNPISDRRTIEAAHIVSRAYEEIYSGAR